VEQVFLNGGFFKLNTWVVDGLVSVEELESDARVSQYLVLECHSSCSFVIRVNNIDFWFAVISIEMSDLTWSVNNNIHSPRVLDWGFLS